MISSLPIVHLGRNIQKIRISALHFFGTRVCAGWGQMGPIARIGLINAKQKTSLELESCNWIKCNDVAGFGKATAVHILGPKSQDQIAKGHHGCLRGAMRGAIWSIRASQVDQLPLEPS